MREREFGHPSTFFSQPSIVTSGQVLANITAMGSEKFGLERLGGQTVGKMDFDKMNTLGGSLVSITIFHRIVRLSCL